MKLDLKRNLTLTPINCIDWQKSEFFVKTDIKINYADRLGLFEFIDQLKK